MTGMISRAQKMTIRQYCDTAIEQISRGQMVDAFGTWDVSSQSNILKSQHDTEKQSIKPNL